MTSQCLGYLSPLCKAGKNHTPRLTPLPRREPSLCHGPLLRYREYNRPQLRLYLRVYSVHKSKGGGDSCQPVCGLRRGRGELGAIYGFEVLREPNKRFIITSQRFRVFESF